MTGNQATNRLMRFNFLFLFVICCSLFSCNNEQPVFDNYHTFKGMSWGAAEEVLFNFEIEDISIPYQVSLKLRNNTFYPYQNLWVTWEEYKDDEIIKKDTIEFHIADEYGNWLGQGFSLFQSSRLILSNHKYKAAGEYNIRIRHDMSDENLHGLEDIGLCIEKTAN